MSRLPQGQAFDLYFVLFGFAMNRFTNDISHRRLRVTIELDLIREWLKINGLTKTFYDHDCPENYLAQLVFLS